MVFRIDDRELLVDGRLLFAKPGAQTPEMGLPARESRPINPNGPARAVCETVSPCRLRCFEPAACIQGTVWMSIPTSEDWRACSFAEIQSLFWVPMYRVTNRLPRLHSSLAATDCPPVRWTICER